MIKQKTQKEAERDNNFIILFSLIIILILGGYGIYKGIRVEKLQDQLSECQEQVEVWTLEVKYQATNMTHPSRCALNRWCVVYWDSHQLEKNFSSYQDYEDALKEFKNMCKEEYIQNCEVIE